MTMLLRRVAPIVASATALLTSGCLERFEMITVKPDTSVAIEARFRGAAAEFVGGDALPVQGGAWRVQETVEKDPQGGADEVSRTATLEIPAGGAMPGSYAVDAAREAVSLRFPTTVTSEVRGDGVYYHFRRVYERRDEAAYTLTRRRFEGDADMKRLAEADPATLKQEDVSRLINAFEQIEMDKQLRYVAAGVRALGDVSQDTGLRIRAAVVAAGKSFDTTRALALVKEPQTEVRDAEIEALASKFDADLRAAAEAALRRERLSPKETEGFLAAYSAERRRREVTEDLSDERWEIRLRLPGDVVAHNADEVEGEVLVWKFDGAAIMDADCELMATSVLRGASR